MSEFPVELTNPDESLVVKLNKLPKQGSWFDLGDGTQAQAKVLRRTSGDLVIFAVRGFDADKGRLEP